MKKTLLLILACFVAGAAQAQPKKIGNVVVDADSRMLGVQVSGSTGELNALAQQAFQAHGRYHVVATGGQFVIKFTQAGPNQVRVDVTRPGGGSVISQTVSGSSNRNALLKAADVAVVATNQQGLKGIFASKVAFISERTGHKEIYVGDLFFGEVRQITRDNAQALTPRWSADGSRIVYTSFYKSGFPDIFQIDMSTFQRTNLASFKGTNSGARFSPNGRYMAMVLSGEGNPEIYVSQNNGKNPSRLTRTDAVEASPCFSPDSSRLVYTSDAAGGPQLYILPVTGGVPSRISTGLSSYCAEPDWSRGNPNKIAFTHRVGRGYQIAVYDLSTRAGNQVSKASYDGIEPCWLADGRHLLYTARTPSDSRICLLDTETGKTTVLSPTSLGQALQSSVYGP